MSNPLNCHYIKKNLKKPELHLNKHYPHVLMSNNQCAKHIYHLSFTTVQNKTANLITVKYNQHATTGKHTQTITKRTTLSARRRPP